MGTAEFLAPQVVRVVFVAAQRRNDFGVLLLERGYEFRIRQDPEVVTTHGRDHDARQIHGINAGFDDRLEALEHLRVGAVVTRAAGSDRAARVPIRGCWC